jgi:hypothetical protein
MAKQLTVFVENRPGRVNTVAGILAEAGFNVWAFTIQDRGEFGLMKLIVDRPKDAQLALEDRNLACAIKDVLAITAKDKSGNLGKLTEILLKKGVNIADAYGFVAPKDKDKEGLCFLELKDASVCDIEEALADNGFTILSDSQLYEL